MQIKAISKAANRFDLYIKSILCTCNVHKYTALIGLFVNWWCKVLSKVMIVAIAYKCVQQWNKAFLVGLGIGGRWWREGEGLMRTQQLNKITLYIKIWEFKIWEFKIWEIRKQQDNGMAFWAFYNFINHIAYNVNDVLEHAGTPFSVAWNSC